MNNESFLHKESIAEKVKQHSWTRRAYKRSPWLWTTFCFLV